MEGENTQQKDIDGFTVSITKLTGWKTTRMVHRLFRALNPPIGAALAGIQTGDASTLDLDKMDASVLLRAVGHGLPRLFDNLSEEELVAISKTLLETAFITVDGKTQQLLPQFDTLMQGRPGTIFKILNFALEVNYGGFFAVAREAAQKQMAVLRASAGSPKTPVSVGPVGVS